MIEEAMSQDDFWASENAIVRAKVLQNPAIMAGTIELMQQAVAIMQRDIEEMKKWQKLLSDRQWTTRLRAQTNEPLPLHERPMPE